MDPENVQAKFEVCSFVGYRITSIDLGTGNVFSSALG